MSSLNRKTVSSKTKDITIENELKKLKHLISAIFVVKTILMKMAIKIIIYFNQFLNI